MATAEVMTEEFNELVLHQLECPICLDYCVTPIVQCENGHNVCAKCRSRIKQCAVCKGRMTNIRNLFAEEISTQITYPCKYEENGCSHRCLLKDVDEHVKTCLYGLTCQILEPSAKEVNAYSPCPWRGSRFELLAHVKKAHPHCFFVSNSFPVGMIRTQKLIPSDRFLISAPSQLFWVLINHDEGTSSLRGLVSSIGSEQQAAKFEYHIQLCSKDEHYVVLQRGSVVSFNAGLLSDGSGKLVCQGADILTQFIRKGIIRSRVSIALKTAPWRNLSWEVFHNASLGNDEDLDDD